MNHETDALLMIGDLQLSADDAASARRSYEAVIQIARERSDRTTEFKALSALVKLARYHGDKASEMKLLEEQFELASSVRDKAVVGAKIAELLVPEGKRDRACAMLRQALEYYESVNHEIVDDLRNHIRSMEEAGVEK